jgi:hypothetical protein
MTTALQPGSSEFRAAAAAPLSAVLAQVGLGTPTVAEMARNTGLAESTVRAGLDHLVRTGRLHAQELPIGCPPGGCGGCGAAASCGVSAAPAGRRVLTLSLAR